MHPFAILMDKTPDGFPFSRQQREMASLILDRFERAGLSTAAGIAAVVNAYAESRLDPKAWGDRTDPEGIGCSGGLFQLNRCAGLGIGMSRADIVDPIRNIDRILEVTKKSRVFRAAPQDDAHAMAQAITVDVLRPSNKTEKGRVRAAFIDKMWPGLVRFGSAEVEAEGVPVEKPEPWNGPTWSVGRVDRDWSQAQKWASLDVVFKSKLTRVVASLRAEGFRPILWFGWRRPGMQAELVKSGRSRTGFSLHEALGPDGEPASVAADLIDPRYQWGIHMVNGKEEKNPATFDGALRFFKALGRVAKREGLTWGGDYQVRPGVWADAKIGWDPGHVQGVPGSQLPAIEASTRKVMEEMASRSQDSGETTI